MSMHKTEILNNICYTELVYNRINKKLNRNYLRFETEKMILDIIQQTEERFFQRIGKNVYVTNAEKNIKITININTYRVITVDRLK